jgi:hypothetical protein
MLNDGKHRRVIVSAGGHHRSAARQGTRHGREGGLGHGVLPLGAGPDTAGHPADTVLDDADRAAPDPAKGKRPLQQGPERIALVRGTLQVTGQGGQCRQSALQIFQDQEQDAKTGGEDEKNIEVVAPWIPGTAGPEQRVVQMVKSPQEKNSAEQRAGPGPGSRR